MRKLSILTFVLAALVILSSCNKSNRCNFSICIPIENCSLVSYDNHCLTDNGVNIYCPSGSPIVAAMDGIVNKIQFDSSSWIVEVINPSSNLVSLYKSVDSLNISIGDTILIPNISMILIASIFTKLKDYMILFIIFYLVIDFIYIFLVSKKNLIIDNKNYYINNILTFALGIII